MAFSGVEEAWGGSNTTLDHDLEDTGRHWGEEALSGRGRALSDRGPWRPGAAWLPPPREAHGHRSQETYLGKKFA